MKKTLVAVVVGVVLGVAGSWFAPLWLSTVEPETHGEPAPQPSAALPDLPEPFYRVLFENDAVRVVQHRLDAGQAEPEHTHAPMVVYFVEGATVAITEADGSQSEVTVGTDTVLDNPRWWTHALENTGDTPLHSILVEFKGAPPAAN